MLRKNIKKSCSVDLEVLSAAILHVTQSVIMLSVVILRVIALPGIADSLVHHSNTQNKSYTGGAKKDSL